MSVASGHLQRLLEAVQLRGEGLSCPCGGCTRSSDGMNSGTKRRTDWLLDEALDELRRMVDRCNVGREHLGPCGDANRTEHR